jgi:hypothetical protein
VNTIITQKISKYILPLGVLLSVIQFFYNRSLWLDEAFIANNLINRSFLELLHPLDDNQVAPILYLFLQKLMIVVFNYNELSFKILPLIFYIFSALLFYKIIHHYFSNDLVKILVFSIFSTNYVLIYYSSEIKQYIFDVFVTLWLYNLSIKLLEHKNHKFICFAGIVSIFLSNVSVIVLFTCWLFLFYNYFINKNNSFKKLILIGFIWTVFFGIYYFAFIHNHPTKAYMLDYWLKAGAFMPYSPFDSLVYIFLGQKIDMIFGGLLSNVYWIGFIFSIIAFIFILIKRKISLLILLFCPIITHLILSAFKLYPFSSQVTTYLTLIIIILIGYGFYILLKLFPKMNHLIVALIIPIIFFTRFIINDFPLEKEEIKKAFNIIEQNISKKDKIYVYYASIPAFNFYKNIKIFNLSNQVILGNNCRHNIYKYTDDLKNINDPIWMIFTHYREHEKEIILEYMINKGFVIRDKKLFYGSEVLYLDKL